MKFLKPLWRLWLEGVALLVAAVMVVLALIEWLACLEWGFTPNTLFTIALVAILAAIYLVLDEIRLKK